MRKKKRPCESFFSKDRESHQKCKTESFCRLSVSRAPSVTLTRDTFLPERQRLTNCVAAKYPSAQSEVSPSAAAQKPLSSESQHPSVSRSADSSPLKKRAAFAGTNCGAEKENSAAFQFRRLLPSRSRVTPSSRRKAHGEKLRCHRRKMCKLLLLKS